MKEYMTIMEASKRTNVPAQRIAALIAKGELRGFLVGLWERSDGYIKQEDLRWLADR